MNASIQSRNHAIDIMKFFAALLITNSHMESLYPGRFSPLATGGAFGDAFFFFCSGFLLMMGRNDDFFNWYKRRVNRIFPTIFAVALISIFVFGSDPTLKHTIVSGGGWFVQAIFVFYAMFWFVRRFLSNKMWIAYVIDAIVILVWFFMFWDKEVFILANATYLRWPVYFMIMLLGASVYNVELKKQKGRTPDYSLWVYIVWVFLLVLFYYGYQLLENSYPFLKSVQIVLLPVLMCIVFVFYKICSHTKVLKTYGNKYIHWPVYYISACCLEIYLSGGWSFNVGRSLIHLFPINVVVTFMLIFVVAFLVKVFSNFLSQTFKSEEYNWRGMVKL